MDFLYGSPWSRQISPPLTVGQIYPVAPPRAVAESAAVAVRLRTLGATPAETATGRLKRCSLILK